MASLLQRRMHLSAFQTLTRRHEKIGAAHPRYLVIVPARREGVSNGRFRAAEAVSWMAGSELERRRKHG